MPSEDFVKADFEETVDLIPRHTDKKSTCLPAIVWGIDQLNDFTNAAVGAVFISQFVPSAPSPYDLLQKTSYFAISYLVQDLVKNLGLLLRGNDNENSITSVALRKEAKNYSIAATAGLFVLAGYGVLTFFKFQDLEDQISAWLTSNSSIARAFAELLDYAVNNKATVLAPMLGSIGFLCYAGTAGIVRRIADCQSRGKPIDLSMKQMSPIKYQAYHHVISDFTNFATEESVFYYLQSYQQLLFAHDVRLQLGVMFGKEFINTGVEYVKTAHKRKSINEQGDEIIVQPRSTQFLNAAKSVAKQLMIEGVKFGFGYVVAQWVFSEDNSQEDTPARRAGLFLTADLLGQGAWELFGLFAKSVCKSVDESKHTLSRKIRYRDINS